MARRNGLWSQEQGLLNFMRTYSPPRAHPTYATRRVWRVFSLVAPSLRLSPDTDAYMSDYPFSVQVERVLTPQDLMEIQVLPLGLGRPEDELMDCLSSQRDHYEGTAFDLTQGIAAGPYGDPNRFDVAPQPADNLTSLDLIQGGYERRGPNPNPIPIPILSYLIDLT